MERQHGGEKCPLARFLVGLVRAVRLLVAHKYAEALRDRRVRAVSEVELHPRLQPGFGIGGRHSVGDWPHDLGVARHRGRGGSKCHD